jgi:DNA primase
LPADTQPLNELLKQYLDQRCIPTDYPLFYKTMPRQGIVIPFTHNGQVVGHTTRFLDDRTPKYIQDIQHGYVFGTDLQQDSWQHVLVMEGVFDALSISGLAVLHAEINDSQVRLIRSLGREVTVIPDQDEAGIKLVDRALELGWAVSIPNWTTDVKDVNDAVRQYGKAATMLSIFESRNTSKIKIEMAKKNLLRKITCA